MISTYLLLLLSLSLSPDSGFSFHSQPGRVDVLLDGREFTSFRYAEEYPKPFLYPLRLPSGLTLSRGYPIEPRPGEQQDHPHHRGVWWALGDINGVDFWREAADIPDFGRIVVRKPPSADSTAGALKAEGELVTPQNEVLGTVGYRWVFSRKEDLAWIDVEIGIHADRGQPVKLGDTEEGALGIRLRDEFRQDRGATLLNSDGLVTTEKIWGKRASWVDYSTVVSGQAVGVAIFDHPSNPRHPTWWHARGYGLCNANPFGERDFTGDKSRDGSMTVPAAGELQFRYRIVLHPGDAASAKIPRLYEEFR